MNKHTNQPQPGRTEDGVGGGERGEAWEAGEALRKVWVPELGWPVLRDDRKPQLGLEMKAERACAHPSYGAGLSKGQAALQQRLPGVL